MTAPLALKDLQDWIVAVLKRPLRDRDAKGIPVYQGELLEEARLRVKPGAFLSPEQRIGLYNSQVWYRFFNLLQKDFPTLLSLFGWRDFNYRIAEPYLLAHWPKHPSLSLLGIHLPDFLEKNYCEADRRLVLPLAKLDEAHQRLADAYEAPLPSQDALTAKLTLQPTVSLLEMQADLFTFRKEILKYPPEEWLEREFPPIAWGKERPFVLWCKQGIFHFEELPRPAYKILSCFAKGSTVEAALDNLTDGQAEEAAPFLFSWFQSWCEKGWLK